MLWLTATDSQAAGLKSCTSPLDAFAMRRVFELFFATCSTNDFSGPTAGPASNFFWHQIMTRTKAPFASSHVHDMASNRMHKYCGNYFFRHRSRCSLLDRKFSASSSRCDAQFSSLGWTCGTSRHDQESRTLKALGPQHPILHSVCIQPWLVLGGVGASAATYQVFSYGYSSLA